MSIMYHIIILLIGLVFIVISSGLFCNALEHFGMRLGISEGVTGSIFAAVGTALPETIIPILAIASNTPGSSNHQISIGAILGAPLMLSTLSIFLMAMSVIRLRGFKGKLTPEYSGITRDIKFFFFGYALAIVAIFVQSMKWHAVLNCVLAILLGFSYFIYLLLTIKASARLAANGYATQTTTKLFLSHFGIRTNQYSIVSQLILATLMLVYFADLFIDSVGTVATVFNFSPFLLALIIIPIATELPEKVNSILWIRQNKDTLAFGNITGALVFQGTLLPLIGIVFTDWKLGSPIYLYGFGITLLSVLWLYFNVCKKNLRVWHFSVNGLLYLLNFALCFAYWQ